MINARTFDTFIVNATNRKAFNVCRDFAEGVGVKFAVVYGANGCGKTHLLRAIKHRMEERGKRALYVYAEQIANEMLRVIKSGGESVYDALSGCDALLIDNGQSLLGSNSMTAEISRVIQKLITNGKRVIMMTDRDYADGDGFTARISAPDNPLKIEYVTYLLVKNGVCIDKDTAYYIVQKTDGNMTAVKGAVNTILFHRNVLYSETDCDFIKTII